MILPAQRRQARLAIHRLGTSCTIKEPGVQIRNGYGKLEEPVGWNAVAEERVVRTYTRSDRPSQARHSGGRYRTESPMLTLRDDSAVEEGFRVEFPDGSLYEVDAITVYPTHLEASTTVVN
ncbi:hypothetical protein HTZ84_09540 [Haloterrigena sp. SYSU A558-1]|uniref:Head-to-tail stopper n=1 Tax=Haloterrigena gelatinilytica TaxID=2741724 RepID=A0ABX2LCD6_9EURY|nr:hypothetical protein [Haloterrigena gelatinilytica]NUC72548.1 hypothetical protein [Haloterrigena gelatinilytica]